MANIKSGVDESLLTINSISKAARINDHDLRGNFTGQKATYSASTDIKTATPASTAVFFAIYGSSSKTIRVHKITICATVATAAVYGDLICYKRTAAITGGTKTDLTQVPLDSQEAAGTASIVGLYTAAPTPGTGGGVIASRQAFMPITGTPAVAIEPIIFSWNTREAESPVLRGIAEGLEISFATTPGNIPTVTVETIYSLE